MNRIKNMKFKPLFFIALLSCLIVISSTFAYFYQSVIIPNRFVTMTYDVELEEEFYNTWGTKKVTIVNKEKSSTPVVLRVNYNETWKDGNIILNNLVNGTNVVAKDWTNAFTNDFILGEDGWYYYKKVLDSNSSVQILNSIALNDASYSDYDYTLTFNYEAIQADANAINSIWNKTASITGGNVEWNF